jgi:glycosyltransferase involved in cell wall biosynthesis
VRTAADGDSRIRFLGPLFDQDLLNQLYGNAVSYLHGHSVGGTNPSLLRALGAGATPIAYEVSFNREVAGDDGEYFTTQADLGPLLRLAEDDPAWHERGERLRERMSRLYRWDRVTDDYENLARDLATRQQ